jgi:hypothetical protein
VFVSQYPPAVQFGSPVPEFERRTNGAAIASLVLGILGCVPVITGGLAVIFGIVGIRVARDPRAGGRKLSIFGLVLGLLSLAFWLVIACMMLSMWINSGPQRALAREFIADLSEGNTAGAIKLSAMTLGQDHIYKWSDQLHSHGSLKEVHIRGFFFRNVNGTDQWTLKGVAEYPDADVPFTLVTLRQDTGWRVYRLTLPTKLIFLPDPTSQPARRQAGPTSNP